MHRHLERHKHLLIPFGLLLFLSGCTGAVSKTAGELSKDAMAPVVVPLDQGKKAMDKLKAVDAQQRDQNAQMEEIK